MKRETRLKSNALKALRTIPRTTWHAIQQTAIRGDPDIIGCVDGRFFAIECKNEFEERYDKREKLQRYKLARVIKTGGAALFVTEKNLAFHVDRIRKLVNGREDD